MSAVRMCDKCSHIFSEREDGFTTGTMTRVFRQDGQQRTETVQADYCPSCSGVQAVTPTLAITAVNSTDQQLELFGSPGGHADAGDHGGQLDRAARKGDTLPDAG